MYRVLFYCRIVVFVAMVQAWEHMEERNVIPRETQYMNFLCGLANAGELWKEAAEDSGKLDDLLFSMSYRAR